MQPGEIARLKGEDGFFVVVRILPPNDVFVVPLKKREDAGYVRLASEQGRYATIADLEEDFTAMVVEAQTDEDTVNDT